MTDGGGYAPHPLAHNSGSRLEPVEHRDARVHPVLATGHVGHGTPSGSRFAAASHSAQYAPPPLMKVRVTPMMTGALLAVADLGVDVAGATDHDVVVVSA